MRPASPNTLQVAWSPSLAAQDRHVFRHFLGLHLDRAQQTLHGCLLRIWGTGYAAVPDVVACSRTRDSQWSLPQPRRWNPQEMAERAAQVLSPLTHRPDVDPQSLRAVGLLDVGVWHEEQFTERSFEPLCHQALLARLSGLTVIDDFPARDLVHGGRGGPCEATAAWLLLGDKSLVPGRRIRALVEIDQALRLMLIPPRQSLDLPDHLLQWTLQPACREIDAITRLWTPHEPFDDDAGQLAVQGRHLPELLHDWREVIDTSDTRWSSTPTVNPEWIVTYERWAAAHAMRREDILCTWSHVVADSIVAAIRHDLPRSHPIGQLILSGRARRHRLLTHRLQHQLPEMELGVIDDFAVPSESWRAAAAALLAMLHVDQCAANSPALTGADAPRILGTITPGPPTNWHRVLADMAMTLPDRIPLRKAV